MLENLTYWSNITYSYPKTISNIVATMIIIVATMLYIIFLRIGIIVKGTIYAFTNSAN